jgi:hypothetical protein
MPIFPCWFLTALVNLMRHLFLSISSSISAALFAKFPRTLFDLILDWLDFIFLIYFPDQQESIVFAAILYISIIIYIYINVYLQLIMCYNLDTLWACNSNDYCHMKRMTSVKQNLSQFSVEKPMGLLSRNQSQYFSPL